MTQIGIDLVDIRKMRGAASRWGDRLLKRIFTADELQYCKDKKDPVPHLAARFAAKEAAKKALAAWNLAGTPFHRIEVKRTPEGRPFLDLAGFESSLSLSHHGDYALAGVVLQKV